MPRIIMKSPYFKPGDSHASNFIKYIAIREGVDKTDDTWKLMPTTYNQKNLITQILRDFPDSADMFEYEDYSKSGTRGNASEFITRALEENTNKIAGRKTYVNYIATRPRVEKLGSHGLFTDSDIPVDLKNVAEDVGSHEGNIWTHIISLRREDAERLGFDNAARWKALMRSHSETIAGNMKIELNNFRWFAAYHDEGHHPHIHMVAYSVDPKEGYLSVTGIENIKSALAKDIFNQDLISVYSEQTKRRDELTAESRSAAFDIIRQINEGVYDNQKVEQLLASLYERLQNHKGKKQFGYLKSDVKALVDTIVDELAAEPKIAELYDLWYEKRFDVLRTYRKEVPEKLPLSQQQAFKKIKNIVIAEALNIGNGSFTFEDDVLPETDNPIIDEPEEIPDDGEPPLTEEMIPIPEAVEYHAEWNKEYKEARVYLYGSDDVEQDFSIAYELMVAEAEKGNAFALYDVGRMHMDGLGCDKDMDTAQEWFSKAYQAFTVAEQEWEKNAYIQYRLGKMNAQGFGVEQSFTAAANWYEKSVAQGNPFAAYALGGLHYRGEGVGQDFCRAFDLYTMAAEDEKRPNVFAMYELGKMCRDGIGTEKNPTQAKHWFTNAYNGFVTLEEETKDDKLQYRLGQMNLTGTGTLVNLQNAHDYFEQSAKLENINAMYGLGKLYMNKEFKGYDINKAVEWLTEAVNRDHEFAKVTLGKFYLHGESATKNVPYGIQLLEQAAEQENQWAQYTLGKAYLDGKDVPMDIRKAVDFLFASAKQENQYAEYTLGKLFLKGELIRKEPAYGIQLLEQAAKQGNEWAQYLLGKEYLSGENVPINPQKAAAYFGASAEQGNQWAQYKFAKLLLSGEYFPTDIPKAVDLLTASADQDNEQAQYTLGKLLLKGELVPKDIPRAVELLTGAAEKGNQYAQFALGKLFIENKDVPKNIHAALFYLEQAAAQENHYALYTLGKLYLYGTDVVRDEEKAVRYLTASAEKGNPFAAALLKNMGKNRNHSLFMGATRLLLYLSRIIADRADDRSGGRIGMVDKKLRSKIDEKKAAHGLRQE